MRVFHRLSPLLLLAALAPAAQAVTVEQIPSPRPQSWVVDLTSTLSSETRQQIDLLSDAVKAQTGAEMVVVVVDTTEGVPSRDFATRLANTWGIGERGKDNGLLVFAALADHKAEIVLGNGLDDESRVRESQIIMQIEMVPRFRTGDPAGALLQGAAACAKRILGADVALQEPVAAAPPLPAPAEPLPSAAPPIPQTQAPQPLVSPAPAPSSGLGILPGIGVGGAFLLCIGGIILWAVLMLRPPRCQQCKQTMQQLSEDADDADLSSSERTEERIGSVDYQIWFCPVCGQKKRRRMSSFSGYTKCPSCSAQTLWTTRSTVREATYTYGGEVRVDSQCANCSYSDSQTYFTPQLKERTYDSSSSSSSSSLLSSSSSSSSSSSGSSSSDSGFSGGSSSGGGASGSW